MLAGACLALCFWSKYAAFALAGSLGLFLLLDPRRARAWRTPGPWLMALAFLVVIAPNLWWLVETGFMPLRYVDGARQGRDALVPVPDLSAAMDRGPGPLPRCRRSA